MISTMREQVKEKCVRHTQQSEIKHKCLTEMQHNNVNCIIHGISFDDATEKD